jgi:hypothetical protein
MRILKLSNPVPALPGSALDPVHHQGELLRTQALALALSQGRGKSPRLQPLGAKDQPRTIPEKNLESIARFVNENKQKARSRFLLERFLNQKGKPIETLPSINRPGSQENASRW